MLAGCSGGGPVVGVGVPGANPPTPVAVKSRQDAEAWAAQLLDHVKQAAGAEAGQGSSSIQGYFTCRGTGVAEPREPYVLNHLVVLDVPADRRVDVVRKVRDALRAEGLTIRDYEEASSPATPSTAPAVPTASFEAERPDDHRTVRLDSARPGTGVSVSVGTPCLAPPPGATAG